MSGVADADLNMLLGERLRAFPEIAVLKLGAVVVTLCGNEGLQGTPGTINSLLSF